MGNRQKRWRRVPGRPGAAPRRTRQAIRVIRAGIKASQH